MNATVKRRTAGSVIASVLLSVLLLLPMILGVFLAELRAVMSQEGVGYYLDRIQLGRIDASELYPGKKGSLLDDLVDTVNENLKGEQLSAEKVEELIEETGVKPFLAREIGEILEDLKTGRTEAAVTPREVTALIEKNWSLFEPMALAEVEEEMNAAVDLAAAGKMDPDYRQAILEYRKAYGADPKYDTMLNTIESTGGIRAADRDLLLEFTRDELLSRSLKEELSETVNKEMTSNLSTAYIRSQMQSDERKALDTVFSIVPVLILVGICAVLIILYFVADRHIPGDAFIGIGSLLVTVLGPLACVGCLYTGLENAWLNLCGGNYLVSYVVGAFEGFHLKANLIGAAAGLGMIVLGIVINTVTRRRTAQV